MVSTRSGNKTASAAPAPRTKKHARQQSKTKSTDSTESTDKEDVVDETPEPEPKKAKTEDAAKENDSDMKQSTLDMHVQVEDGNGDVKESKEETMEKEAASNVKSPRTSGSEVHHAEHDLERNSEVLEYGRIFFFFKPKVNKDHAGSIDDVARLHMVLQPSEGPSRLLIVGKKFLPDPNSKRQPIWAFVKQVADKPGDISSHLGESSYQTKTQGTSHVGEDRLIGEGPYALVYHKGEKVSDAHSTLVYVLEAPEQLGEVQKAFNLTAEGRWRFSVKNPHTSNPPQAGLKEHAKFSEDLQSRFEGRRWDNISSTKFLDTENAELLIVSHHADPETAGQGIADDLEKLAAEDAEHTSEGVVPKRILEELHLKKGTVDLKTISGNWN